MKYAQLAAVLASLVSGAEAKGRMVPDDLPGPPAEVTSEPAVAMPAVPRFEVPPVEAGIHTPRELRVHGRPLLGRELLVKGYVTAIYDCAAALSVRMRGLSRAQLLQQIDDDPRRCEQPKFYLGDLRGASREASITVVDVPRPPARPEREAMSRAELAHWPAAPKLAVGDYVVVTGLWQTTSPHGERSLRGLLVYRAVAPSQPTRPTTAAPVSLAAALPPIDVVTQPPLRALIDNVTYNQSVDPLNACTKALRELRYDDAVAQCEASTRAWPDNHRAFFGWATAYVARSQWQDALAPIQRAVALRPDVAMYQLYDGVVRYEAELARARAAQDAGPDDEVDPAALSLDDARDALRRAVRLSPELWRAHYYLGRLYLELGDDRDAAIELGAAIARHSSYQPAYLRLAELYRRWGYVDEAVAVATLGTAHVAPSEGQALWLAAGMALADRGAADAAANDRAIAALGHAIGVGNTLDVQAKFQRGQVYLRKGELIRAQQDMLDVLRMTGRGLDELRPIAAQILVQIAQQRASHDKLSYCHGNTQC